MIHLLWALLAAFSLNAYAIEPCDDLYSATCHGEAQNDGTGLMKNLTSEEKLLNTARQIVEKAQPKIKEALQSDKELREAALYFSELEKAEVCQKPQMAAECDIKIMDYLSKAAILGVGGRNYSSDKVSLAAADYFTNSSSFKHVVREVKDQVFNSKTVKENEKRVRDVIFPQVKKSFLRKIAELPLDEKHRKILADRVQSTQFGGSDCSIIDSGLNELYITDGFYNQNTLTICKGYLAEGVSEFTIAALIGHELAHSIDPCALNNAGDGATINYSNINSMEAVANDYPVSGLIECLRSEKSIEAKSSSMQPSKTGSKKYDLCTGDQITESVADWFGSQLMAEYIEHNHSHLTSEQWRNGVANAYRGLCSLGGQPSPGFDAHPSPEKRLNAILMTNPKIRQNMKCSPRAKKYIYCDASNPDAMALEVQPRVKSKGGASGAGTGREGLR